MAKKQTIILTHGSKTPEGVLINKGEVLVQHAEFAKDAALWTVLNDGSTQVSFPSKEWVNDKFAGTGGINEQITALDERLETIEDDYLTSLDKNELSGAINNLKNTEVKANTDAIAKEVKDRGDEIIRVEGIVTALEANLQGQINDKVATDTYEAKVESIESDIDAVELILKGYTGEGSVKSDVNSKVAQSEYNTKVANFESRISANETYIQNIENTFYTETEIDTKVATINENIVKAKTTLTEDAGVTEGVKVVASTEEDGHVNYTVTAVGLATETEMNAVEGRLDVIEGKDSGNSMREVAADEVKKLENMLYGEGSQDAIDTLKDVIDWIADENSGAADIIKDVAELQGTLTGFTSAKTVQETTDSLAARIAKFEDGGANSVSQVLETAKGYTDTQVGIEKKAREDADKAINGIIGDGFSASNTVAQVIAKEVQDRKDAVQGIQDEIEALGDTYATDDELSGVKSELEGKIAKAKTTITEASPAFGVKVQKTNTDPNNYEISLVDVAKASDLTALDTAAVKSAVVTNTETNKITASVASNTLTLNFDSMVIDGGEY